MVEPRSRSRELDTCIRIHESIVEAGDLAAQRSHRPHTLHAALLVEAALVGIIDTNELFEVRCRRAWRGALPLHRPAIRDGLRRCWARRRGRCRPGRRRSSRTTRTTRTSSTRPSAIRGGGCSRPRRTLSGRYDDPQLQRPGLPRRTVQPDRSWCCAGHQLDTPRPAPTTRSHRPAAGGTLRRREGETFTAARTLVTTARRSGLIGSTEGIVKRTETRQTSGSIAGGPPCSRQSCSLSPTS